MATISAGQFMITAEKEANNQVTGQAQGPARTSYLGLLTNAASGSLDDTWTTAVSATEYGATGYARQAFGPGAASNASPCVASNAGTITFGPFTSSPGTSIVWGMLMDASTGTAAKLLIAYLLATARTPISGDSLQAAAGSFTSTV